jgi:hypothetical protein
MNVSSPSAAEKLQPVAQAGARRHVAGGAGLGRHHSREAQCQAAAILEVLAGARTPTQAAEALGVSVPRYYQLEGRALRGLVSACEPRSKGRGSSPARELALLRRQHDRVQRELVRQQTLLRMAQRSIGLAPPPPVKKGGKKRVRRPVVRALGVAIQLRAHSEDPPVESVESVEPVASSVSSE